jgi:hypothetical protein
VAHRHAGPAPIEATVSIRHDFDDTVETIDWELAPATLPKTTAPWRTFRWRYGQRHYSGCYWCATQRDHVIYESRLERTKLIYADFDRTVSHVVAQPFLMEAIVGKKRRWHVPDFFLSAVDGPTVVDVKPAARLENPKVAFTLAWTRRLVEERGWRYEVWTEPPRTEFSNLSFLAGYRDPRRFDQELVRQLSEADLEGCPLADAFRCKPSWSGPIVRAAVLHLLWRGDLSANLCETLSPKSVLHIGGRNYE